MVARTAGPRAQAARSPRRQDGLSGGVRSGAPGQSLLPRRIAFHGRLDRAALPRRSRHGARAFCAYRRRLDQPGRARARGLLARPRPGRSEEHTSELQSPCNLVCRLLLEKKKKKISKPHITKKKKKQKTKN